MSFLFHEDGLHPSSWTAVHVIKHISPKDYVYFELLKISTTTSLSTFTSASNGTNKTIEEEVIHPCLQVLQPSSHTRYIWEVRHAWINACNQVRVCLRIKNKLSQYQNHNFHKKIIKRSNITRTDSAINVNINVHGMIVQSLGDSSDQVIDASAQTLSCLVWQ